MPAGVTRFRGFLATRQLVTVRLAKWSGPLLQLSVFRVLLIPAAIATAQSGWRGLGFEKNPKQSVISMVAPDVSITIFGLRDYARFDLWMLGDEPQVLDVSANPELDLLSVVLA